MLQRLPSVPMLFALTALASAWLCVLDPVFSQEAYYWTYAQHPDLSYFDHPGMSAWLIWLGTHVFGDGAIGLRFGTWLCGLGTAWLGVLILRDLGISRFGQSLWLLLSLGCPNIVIARVLVNPDPPLVFFWTLTIFALWRARGGSFGWWALAGVAAGMALLSKYSAAFLAVGGAPLLLLDPQLRKQLRRPSPYAAVVIAAIVFLPVVIWNVRNGFESFKFQTESRFARGHFGAKWFLQFVGSQFGLFNPMFVLLLPPCLWWLLGRLRSKDPRALLLLAFGLPLPGYMVIQSLWIQVKINWITPAFVPLLLGIVVWWQESGAEQRRPKLLKAAAWGALLMQILVPIAPVVARMLPASRGSSSMGWDQVAERALAGKERIEAESGAKDRVFFFASDYKDSAQLGRGLELHRQAKVRSGNPTATAGRYPVMAQNVLGFAALQFDHWEAPQQHIGQDAIFVVPRPEDRDAMVAKAEQHFKKVEKVDSLVIEWLSMHLMDVDLYACHGYLGPQPPK